MEEIGINGALNMNMNGTPIRELRNNNMSGNYMPSNYMGNEQTLPYYQPQQYQNYQNYPNYPNYQNYQNNNNNFDIDNLARDISDNLSKNDIELLQEDQIVPDKEIIQEEEKKTIKDYVPQVLQEPLLILAIYVFLSQPFVIKFIGKYIKQINPDKEKGCKVPLIGIIIYGILLVSLYSVCKKLFF